MVGIKYLCIEVKRCDTLDLSCWRVEECWGPGGVLKREEYETSEAWGGAWARGVEN